MQHGPILVRMGALALLSVSFAVRSARAQAGPFTPWTGERGITETVAQIMERERALPPGERRVRVLDRETVELAHPPRPNPDSPAVSQWPPQSNVAGPRGPVGLPVAPLTVGTSFLAVDLTESVYVPPDTGGAVGPTQILCSENGRVKVFAKDGTPGPLNVTGDAFFQSVRNNSPAVDPQTKYDRLSGRFILTAINETTPNRVLIAVSSGSVISGTSSFTFYFFVQDQVAPPGNTGQFADYDKAGVDANALYVGANLFDFSTGNYTGSNCYVVRKSSILSGGPIQATAFRGIADAATGLGPVYPMGVDNDDPASTEGYVAGVDGSTFGRLALRRISNPGGSPSISGNLLVTVPTTVSSISQPALGSANPLDSIDQAILFDVQMHRDRTSGVRTLWAAHTIEVDANGVATAGGGRNGARWYQIGNLGTTPTLLQAGTLFDGAASSPKGYLMPSCAMTGQGHAVLGATYAGDQDRAGCAIASRLAGDPPGALGAPAFPVVSANDYNAQGSAPQRWGDMSKVDVDPVDDQTLWAFAEYCSADNIWGVRVLQLLAPPPATPTAANPPSLPQGASNQTVVVTGSSSAGSGFYDTEPGFNRIQVDLGSGVTVSNIVFNGPTQLTLTVSVAGSAAAGPRSIVVTNPDGQVVASASGVFSVVGGSPGTPFCFGDGSLSTPCPCGNFGATGHGCANSSVVAGAVLGSSGTVAPDTVVLGASGERPTAFTIFLQGDVNTGTGIVFGDGLRCADGTLSRLYVKSAVGGAASAPQAGDPSITARSAALGHPIPPGSSRFYQTYYRDPVAAFCPPATFNASNAVRIDW
jgi:hypothetical protein